MIFDLRWAPILIVNICMIFVMQMLNDAIAPLSIFLYLNSLLIISPAFYLEFKGGLFCVIISALAVDASNAVSFGVSLPLFLIAYVIVFRARNRVHPNSKTHTIVINLFVNTILILILSFLLGYGSLLNLSYWGRVFTDIIFSLLALSAFSPLVQKLQQNILVLCGFTLHSEKAVI